MKMQDFTFNIVRYDSQTFKRTTIKKFDWNDYVSAMVYRAKLASVAEIDGSKFTYTIQGTPKKEGKQK